VQMDDAEVMSTPLEGPVFPTPSLVVAWLSGIVGLDQRSYSTSGPVNTWMGDHLRVNHLGITSHLG